MIKIRESHKGNYDVHLVSPIKMFNKTHAQKLKRDIESYFVKQKKFYINLDQVEDFSKEGYNKLKKLMDDAQSKQCEIKYSYFGVDITHRVELLSENQD